MITLADKINLRRKCKGSPLTVKELSEVLCNHRKSQEKRNA
jgi:hypothetical protein